ncbi:MAG: hypothetical protein JNL94_05980, partial [Planctomycetes bacterium]|nr:hypothetical protein [Planctomycetota bacterium]
GGPESPAADGASLPPAWPLDDGIAGIVRWLDAIAGPGTIALAPEAADTVSRLPPRPDRGWVAHDALRGRQASSVVAWLRPAGPTLDPHADRDATPVLRDSALVVEPLDLWRVTPDELAAWLAVRPDAFVVVFGRFAARVTGRATLDATDRGPVLAFTPSNASVPTAPPHATDPTLRAEARTRLVPDLPRTGARALEHLLAHAPGLRANDVPALLARARVELALAILRDDAVAEDHGFGLLEATDGAAIRALRAERARARDRLWIALARMRAADATDADIRFRFGTVLGRGNAPLAGVDELTRCIEFRPTLVDAFEELARAYLGAARRNEFKWTATGALDISYAVERLVVLMHPERVDEASQARMWTLLGRARRAKALRQSEVTARTPLLRDALGRFHRALELRPDDAEALLFQTLALLELEETAAAKASARSAVDAAPLEPRARAVRAAAMVAADRAAARDELRAAFRFGLAFPSSRSR